MPDPDDWWDDLRDEPGPDCDGACVGDDAAVGVRPAPHWPVVDNRYDVLMRALDDAPRADCDGA